jgi:hypothetical protein
MSFEVGLSEHRTGAHVHLEFEEGVMLGGSPVPLFRFPGKIKKWPGDFGVVWDEVTIIPSEAKELANLCRISWGFPSSDTIKFAGVHAHSVLSNYHPQVLNLVFSEFTLGWFKIEVVFVQFL